MKTINNYILEKLHLDKNIKVDLESKLYNLLLAYTNQTDNILELSNTTALFINDDGCEVEKLKANPGKYCEFIATIYDAYYDKYQEEDIDFNEIPEDIVKKLIKYLEKNTK